MEEGMREVATLLTTAPPALQQQRTLGAGSAISTRMANPVARLASLPASVEALPCRFSTQQLVELLKMPACIGEGRRVILDQLGNRYGRRFADQWAFVRFATDEKLGLDFTSPPQR